MKPVVVRPAAEEDIEAAYLWYEGRQAHLGNEFLFAIRSALIQAGQYPEQSGGAKVSSRGLLGMIRSAGGLEFWR
jgi:hypothetical protein